MQKLGVSIVHHLKDRREVTCDAQDIVVQLQVIYCRWVCVGIDFVAFVYLVLQGYLEKKQMQQDVCVSRMDMAGSKIGQVLGYQVK